MKKSSRIEKVVISENGVFFNDQEVDVSQKMSELSKLSLFSDLDSAPFMPNNLDWLRHSSPQYPGILFYTKKETVNKISIVLKIRNSGIAEFEGDISVQGKKLPNPLHSATLEELFPALRLQRERSIYDDTFTPHYANEFHISNDFGLEFFTSRDGKFIGLIKITPPKDASA